MVKTIGLEQAHSFINCQLRPSSQSFRQPQRPAITISRMSGSGGHAVAGKLADYLQKHAPSECPWTVFDRNLVEQVLEEHQLSKRIAEYMTESHRSMLKDTIEEFLGLHPSAWTLVQQTIETIWHLALMGNVILVGRGATVITSRLPSAFHVRLVGSVEKRAKRIEEQMKLSPAAAVDFVTKEDQGRRRYLKEHFGKDITDPLLYHIVINTDHIPEESAAHLIGRLVIERFQLAAAR